MPPKSDSKADKTAGAAATAEGPASFEVALTRLEEIVNRLERGDITLDESLAAFQEGSGLVRYCLDRLSAAEATVQELMAGPGGAPELKPARPGLEGSDDPNA
jgi:exodeoxyribonuclease VII small subunit